MVRPHGEVKKGSKGLCRKPASALLSPANRETYYWYHDYQQVAKDGGDGRAGYWQGSFQRLFPQIQPQKIHPAPTVRLSRPQRIREKGLSRRLPAFDRLLGPAGGDPTERRASLHDPSEGES